MRTQRMLAIGLALLTVSALTGAQTWTHLTHQPTFQTDTALLLTDGTVMMHQYNSTNWWRLTPDTTGSYINGTWTQLASMQSGYEPLYFASAVLIDGRVLVEGGEYNNGSQVETNQGAIYNPSTKAWTTVNPPTGWSTIGDSPAIVLPSGTFMMGQGGGPSTQQVTFNATTLGWTAVTNSGKADGFSEEGFALLSDGNVLTVDTEDGTNSEIYNPLTGEWTSAGSTIVTLPNSGGLGIVPEMGPLMQRPDGSVVAFGATTNTSIYSSATGKWTVGPVFPNSDDIADGNASLLPDGNILVYSSPGVFSGTGTFYEFTYPGNTFISAPATAKSGTLESWDARQLLLPTGQVLWAAADGKTIDVEIYTPSGTYESAWQPTISSVASTLTAGSTNNAIEGTQFNGFAAGTTYGDDAQMASNYPLVRIKNDSTGHVFYCKTHNHSTMGVATGSATVSTQFDVPSNIEAGASTLVVVANGIPSAPVSVTVTFALLAGTSPSIKGLSNGAWQSAFQANSGDLWIYDPKGGATDIGIKMSAGSSPSIAGLSSGWELAFQASTGNLYVFNYLGSITNTGLGMMAGTTPSITGLSNGAWQSAFQANSGDLWIYDPKGGATDIGIKMSAGSSPSIAGLSRGWELAFQASTGNLYVFNYLGSITNTGLGMMAGTTPSITGLSNGAWQSAFQANSGDLWIYDPKGGATDIGIKMSAGSSPSIAGLSSGWELAFQASTGDLYVFNYLGSITNTGLSMMAGTSPSITGLSNGGWVVEFQTNTGDLYTYDSNGTVTEQEVGQMNDQRP